MATIDCWIQNILFLNEEKILSPKNYFSWVSWHLRLLSPKAQSELKIKCKSKTVLGIFLKFSSVVWLKSLIRWQKNFGHSTTCASAAPSFMSKLWEGLAPRNIEIFSRKFFWGGFRHITVTSWQEFTISCEKWHFQNLGMSD